MGDYIQITLTGMDDVMKKELAIALLSDLDCNGFEEEGDVLKAYMDEALFNREVFEKIIGENAISYSLSGIKEQNWNSVWESQFEPVVVDDFAAVRASFHKPITHVTHEIIITPKMSFGTGHHATTYMMMQEMAKLDFTGKSVFDFGTGTGILAILAEKMGATYIWGIDNDNWSIENAQENVIANNCSAITIGQKDKPESEQKFNIILANINKHILLAFMNELAVLLQKDGTLLLSGLLEEDEADIVGAVKKAGLTPIETVKRAKWICVMVQNQ